MDRQCPTLKGHLANQLVTQKIGGNRIADPEKIDFRPGNESDPFFGKIEAKR